ncbi:MAG: nuclease-related domain-containing protein [Solirubrobacteraceae bacterium]
MLTRVAGQHARATTRRHLRRTLATFAALGVVGPAACVAFGFHNLAVVPVELCAIALTFLVDRLASPIVDRWHRGAVGEEQVGKIIDGLREQGWLAIHDAHTGRGNIDHILVGPAGLFTVETKSHAGRIDPDRIDESMLRQAYAQGKVVERITGLAVEPLLVFSRAYLMRRAIARSRGVTILPARMLPRLLASRPQGIPAARVAEVHANLAASLHRVA